MAEARALLIFDEDDLGLAIGDLTFNFIKTIDDATTVSATNSTLVEIGRGYYTLMNPNIVEDTLFSVYPTAQSTKIRDGIFSLYTEARLADVAHGGANTTLILGSRDVETILEDTLTATEQTYASLIQVGQYGASNLVDAKGWYNVTFSVDIVLPADGNIDLEATEIPNGTLHEIGRLSSDGNSNTWTLDPDRIPDVRVPSPTVFGFSITPGNTGFPSCTATITVVGTDIGTPGMVLTCVLPAVAANTYCGGYLTADGQFRSLLGYVGAATERVTLADGSHGGPAASLQLGEGVAITKTSGDAFTVSSGGGDGNAVRMTGNGTGVGLLLENDGTPGVGGAIQLQSNGPVTASIWNSGSGGTALSIISDSGTGLHAEGTYQGALIRATALTDGHGLVAMGAGAGKDISAPNSDLDTYNQVWGNGALGTPLEMLTTASATAKVAAKVSQSNLLQMSLWKSTLTTGTYSVALPDGAALCVQVRNEAGTSTDTLGYMRGTATGNEWQQVGLSDAGSYQGDYDTVLPGSALCVCQGSPGGVDFVPWPEGVLTLTTTTPDISGPSVRVLSIPAIPFDSPVYEICFRAIDQRPTLYQGNLSNSQPSMFAASPFSALLYLGEPGLSLTDVEIVANGSATSGGLTVPGGPGVLTELHDLGGGWYAVVTGFNPDENNSGFARVQKISDPSVHGMIAVRAQAVHPNHLMPLSQELALARLDRRMGINYWDWRVPANVTVTFDGTFNPGGYIKLMIAGADPEIEIGRITGSGWVQDPAYLEVTDESTLRIDTSEVSAGTLTITIPHAGSATPVPFTIRIPPSPDGGLILNVLRDGTAIGYAGGTYADAPEQEIADITKHMADRFGSGPY